MLSAVFADMAGTTWAAESTSAPDQSLQGRNNASHDRCYRASLLVPPYVKAEAAQFFAPETSVSISVDAVSISKL